MSRSRTGRLNCSLRSKLCAAIQDRVGSTPKASHDPFTIGGLTLRQAFDIDKPYVVKHVSNARPRSVPNTPNNHGCGVPFGSLNKPRDLRIFPGPDR